VVDFPWDPVAQRYRGPSGAFVPESAVRAAVEDVVELSTTRVQALTARLAAGTLDLAAWQQQMALELKAAHLATATAARGGWAQMSLADFGWVGQRLRGQYAFLRDWASALADGTAPLDGRAPARAALYSEASRSTYEEARRRGGRLAGRSEERRVLRASEHCAGCRTQAARGWQPAGTLPGIGTQECRSRCRCSFETRLARRDAA
jgi:hypothetical protein